MKLKLILALAGALALCAPVAFAQKKTAKGDPHQDAFANPVDVPGLPRVLIIGDSISIGYTPRVRKLLDQQANVHRPKTNCRWSAFGDENIESWIGDSHWDVIHFNFGLWDWYGWSQETKATPESYAKSLDSIVQKLKKKTDAKLIFAITTPPCVGPEKKVKIVITEKQAKAFNKAARTVMDKHDVGINNLYDAIIKKREQYQRGPDDVHYTDEARDVLATQVAAIIGREIGITSSGAPQPTPAATNKPAAF